MESIKIQKGSNLQFKLLFFLALMAIGVNGIAAAMIEYKAPKLKDMKSKTMISNLKLSDYTTAELQAFKSLRIKATPEKLWETIGDHASIPEWVPMIKHVDVITTNADENGVGCERVCTFGGDKVYETVLYIEKNRLMAYKAADSEDISNHLGVIEIVQDGEYSIVNWYQYFDASKGMKGFMMKNIMMPRILKKALKNLDKRAA